MDKVYLLWYVVSLEGVEDEELLIGAYRSEEDARMAIKRLQNQSGFVDHPEGFTIAPYNLNEDHWTEGYVVD